MATITRSPQSIREHLNTDKEFGGSLCTCRMCLGSRAALADLMEVVTAATELLESTPRASAFADPVAAKQSE